MPKSLGMIHNVEASHTITSPPGGGDAGSSNHLIDLAGSLTAQLQHMVRGGGNSFKCTGIDIAVDWDETTGADPYDFVVDGTLAYYSPTRGRCDAIRHAWDATRKAMALQGVDYHSNKNYDFRPLIAPGLTNAADFGNQASLEVVGGVLSPLYLNDAGGATNGVFEVWNESVQPAQALPPTFTEGWNVMQQIVPQDYVLNEKKYLDAGGAAFASEDYDTIPFQLSYAAETGIVSSTFQFRPDPALYQSILTGQIILFVDNAVFTNVAGANTPSVKLLLTFYVAGWKSIMGGRRRRKHRSKRRG